MTIKIGNSHRFLFIILLRSSFSQTLSLLDHVKYLFLCLSNNVIFFQFDSEPKIDLVMSSKLYHCATILLL